MSVEIIPAEHRDVYWRMEAVLRSECLVVFPTDTIYGLGGLAWSKPVIQKIYQTKGRDENKPVAVLIGSYEQFDQVSASVNGKVHKLVERFFPGALTVIVPRHPSLPESLSPRPTIGVRMPDHPLAQEILRRCGPLAVTSANISGQDNPKNMSEILDQLTNGVNLYVDGGPVQGGIASTVVDCTGSEIKIVREGAIPAADIWDALR